MLKAIKSGFDHFSSHVTVWSYLFGSGVLSTGIVTALIARATVLIAPWGAIGWWGLGLLGALTFALIFVCCAKGHNLLIDSHFRKKLYQATDAINPLENLFEKKRIKLVDMVVPFDLAIRDKTFRNCDILGPCNILLGDGTEIMANHGQLVQAAIVKENHPIANVIAFENCSIRNCRFYQITFLIPESIYPKIASGMHGINWITRIPN